LILLIKRCYKLHSLKHNVAQLAIKVILQIAQQRLQNDMTQDEKDREVKIAMNAENNLTTERLKTAELTVDELRLRKEQEQTAIKLQNVTQRNLGR
jgi:hypothetical protein